MDDYYGHKDNIKYDTYVTQPTSFQSTLHLMLNADIYEDELEDRRKGKGNMDRIFNGPKDDPSPKVLHVYLNDFLYTHKDYRCTYDNRTMFVSTINGLDLKKFPTSKQFEEEITTFGFAGRTYKKKGRMNTIWENWTDRTVYPSGAFSMLNTVHVGMEEIFKRVHKIAKKDQTNITMERAIEKAVKDGSIVNLIKKGRKDTKIRKFYEVRSPYWDMSRGSSKYMKPNGENGEKYYWDLMKHTLPDALQDSQRMFLRIRPYEYEDLYDGKRYAEFEKEAEELEELEEIGHRLLGETDNTYANRVKNHVKEIKKKTKEVVKKAKRLLYSIKNTKHGIILMCLRPGKFGEPTNFLMLKDSMWSYL